MKVYATSPRGSVISAPSQRRRGAGGFTVGGPETLRSAAPAGAPRALGSIDALVALQAFEDSADRRRRAFKRGRTTLDALDELKIAVLGGTLDPALLARLKTAAATLSEVSGDPRLDSILAEIELRGAVELAKFAAARNLQAQSVED